MGSKDSKKSISKPIVNISLISIILGLAVMIVTVSIVTGFQNKIREKVIGFGSHIQITNMEDNTSMESSPLLMDSLLVSNLNKNKYVKQIQAFAYKPAILQSDQNEVIISSTKTADTVRNRDVLGVLFKGINQHYDMSFFNDKLIKGQLIDFDSEAQNIIISSKIAQLLHYSIGDTINAYFIINNTPKKRNFTVSGIYETGLEDFDKKIIFTDIAALQSLSNWGISSAITVSDTCIDGRFVIKGLSYGNYEYYQYKWNDQPSQSSQYTVSGSIPEVVSFEAAEYNTLKDQSTILWDKSIAKIKIDSACTCSEEILTAKPIKFMSEEKIKMPFGEITIENGVGTGSKYIGGYEVLIDEWKNLNKMDSIIYQEIPFKLKTTKITDLHVEIFSWLNFLDMNIAVIILMMLIVSLINMVTSLLVLIIEKTNFIGILKAVGATSWSIRKIFIFNALILLLKGLIWGNIIGITFILVQHYFNIIPLNPKIYYLDSVPVNFSILNILLINGLTILTCLLVLIIPSYLITKIRPIRAIKFN